MQEINYSIQYSMIMIPPLYIYVSPHHKVEATHVLNGLTCILSEELLANSNDFITISGIK